MCRGGLGASLKSPEPQAAGTPKEAGQPLPLGTGQALEEAWREEPALAKSSSGIPFARPLPNLFYCLHP